MHVYAGSVFNLVPAKCGTDQIFPDYRVIDTY